MIETSRRSLITGLISLIAAPAIIRAGSLMPVKTMLPLGPLATFELSREEAYNKGTHIVLGQVVRYIEECNFWIYDGSNWIKIND